MSITHEQLIEAGWVQDDDHFYDYRPDPEDWDTWFVFYLPDGQVARAGELTKDLFNKTATFATSITELTEYVNKQVLGH